MSLTPSSSLARPKLGDYLLASVCALIAILYTHIALHPGDLPPATATAQMLLAWSLTITSLFWRTHPRTAGISIAVLLALWAGTFWEALPIYTGFTPYLILAGFVIYSWIRWLGTTAWKITTVMIALLGAIISPAVAIPTSAGIRYDTLSVAIHLLAVAFIWLLARQHRAHDQAVAQQLMREQEKQQQQEREAHQRAELAIHQERVRIASEIHDILAHSLTLVHARSTAGLIAGKSNPSEALSALEDVRESASAALGQMRTLVKSLHSSHVASPVLPTGDLRDIPGRIERFKTSGLHLVADIPSDQQLNRLQKNLPLLTRLALMRTLEEALTNALRYADMRQPTYLELSGHHQINLRLQNTIHPDAESIHLGTGTGLIGLCSRVEELGGTFSAKPQGDKTFELSVTLPAITPEETI